MRSDLSLLQKANLSVPFSGPIIGRQSYDKKSSPFKVVKQSLSKIGRERDEEKQFFTKTDRSSKKLRLFFTEEDDHPEHQLPSKNDDVANSRGQNQQLASHNA